MTKKKETVSATRQSQQKPHNQTRAIDCSTDNIEQPTVFCTHFFHEGEPPRTFHVQKRINPSKTLECPCCGSEFMHQIQVDTMWRIKEDGPGQGITSTKYKTDHYQLENHQIPASGDYIQVHFACEKCYRRSVLSFTQCKGFTVLRWHVDGTVSHEVLHG